MTRFFLSIATQFENLGDALIHRELALLASEYGEVVVEWSRCPKSFRRTLDLQDRPNIAIAHSRKNFLAAMLSTRARGGRAILLMKPGAEIGPRGFGSAKAEAILSYYAALRMAGVEIMQFGISYERLAADKANFLRRRGKHLARHYVRDGQSLEYATAQGFAVDGVLPDMAFYQFTNNPVKGREPAAGLTLGLSFRSGQYDAQYAQIEQIVREALSTLGQEQHLRVRLVSQVTWDAATMDRVASMVRSEFAIEPEFFDVHADIDKAQAVYRDCDLIISNRLHVLLLGATVCPAVLACADEEHNAKIVGLFRSHGWENSLHVLGQDGGNLSSAALHAAMNSSIDGAAMAAALRGGFRKAVFGERCIYGSKDCAWSEPCTACWDAKEDAVANLA